MQVEEITEGVEEITGSVPDWAVFVVMAGIIVAAAVVSLVVGGVLRLIGHRKPAALRLNNRIRRPLRGVLLATAVLIDLQLLFDITPPWTNDFENGIIFVTRLLLIAACGWLLTQLLLFFLDVAVDRYSSEDPADYTARRRRTQMLVIRRIVIAVAVILTIGAMALTIPGAEAFGASLLASAGLVSLVAGIAAQSTLGNFIAGVQLAFSNALKVGDTLVVENELGTVEEVTLTYVVVQIWDDRRLVLPSTYFTTTPFVNWTRNQTALTGTVLLDVDWRVDIDALRVELDRILSETTLWDRRSSGLIVVDAVNGHLQLRAAMTAANGDDLWTLRCLVRERLVAFIQRTQPEALSVQRVEINQRPDAGSDARAADAGS